jgi:hypothetical protein
MASAKPSSRAVDNEAAPDANRATAYRERAAHLRAMAQSEPDPELRAQLLDLAWEYEDMADSAGPRHRAREIGLPPSTAEATPNHLN